MAGILWDFEQMERDKREKKRRGLLGDSITSEISGTSMEFDPQGNPINIQQQAPQQYARQGTGFLGSDQGATAQSEYQSGLLSAGYSQPEAASILAPFREQGEQKIGMLELRNEFTKEQAAQSIKQGNVLRKERGQELRPFIEAKTQYNTTMNALQQDSGAGTLAAIFSFMKTLDPRSVVREGEFQMGTQTGGVVDSLVGMVNRAQGKSMGPESRRGIAETIQAIMEGRQAEAESIAERYDLIAERQNVPTEEIRTGAYSPDLQGVPKSFNVAKDANLPSGTKDIGDGTFRLPDGTLIRKK